MSLINWSHIDTNSLAGRLVRLPARLIPAESRMRIRRGPAQGLQWIVGSAAHGCWLGTFEVEKQQVIARFIRPGMTIYDVGAQAGFFTLFFSRSVGQTGKVVAFEPCPRELCYLLDHLRINGVGNVQVMQVAVGDRRQFSGFSTDAGACMNHLCESSASPLIVSTISLDESSLPAPQLIKIDVEGAESMVLKGAINLLGEHKPVVFVALHSSEQAAACFAILEDVGYLVYDLAGTRIEGNPAADEIYALPCDRCEDRGVTV